MSTERTPTDERLLTSAVWREEIVRRQRDPSLGSWTEPARELPVHARCEVLVVGGGPSGTAAAVSAARAGADVILLERYNHLGGLSTGGLVIWIDRMTDWDGQLVIRGFAEELLSRLPPGAVAGPPREQWGSRDPGTVAHWAQRTAAFRDVVTWSPTIDPEWLKTRSQQMLLDSGARLIYHAWAARPIVERDAVRGVVFETKAGRLAVMASVVIDATGDGDLFSRAGAAFDSDVEPEDIHHCMNTSWLFGGVDMNRWIALRAGEPQRYAEFMERGRRQIGLFERPFVSWRDDIALFMGPRQAGYSAVDVDDQTAVEIRSRRLMAAHLTFYREHAPGFEQAYLLQGAPQLGVRHSRRLVGVSGIRREQWPHGDPLLDEIAVSPSLSPAFPSISVPYGALVPERLDGLLACGRHLSCDPSSHGFMREIPQCWLTGQAAGVAAALAARQGIMPRAVPIDALQRGLRAQGAFLRTQAPASPATTVTR